MNVQIKHPYRDAFPPALILMAVSAGISLLGGLLLWLDILSNPALLYIAGIFGVFWGLMAFIIWLMGLAQMRHIADFLASDRIWVSWTYTPEEWESLRRTRYEATQGDWKIALGCLTFIFAVAGALTGVFIGLEEDILAALLDGGRGIIIGAVFGGLLGVIVSGGNALAAWRAFQDTTPGYVALGASELYANAQYFRENLNLNRYICAVVWDAEDPTTLLYELWVPKVRGGDEETWTIYVPPRMRAAVDAILPRIVTRQH
ncbi:MAG: hypothetical protein JXA33_13735 [Anaerolineae bacterium]|nr:hypothetical protein [Anaerolineae bacterium]